MFKCINCRTFSFETLVCEKCIKDMKEIIKQVKEFIKKECGTCKKDAIKSELLDFKCKGEDFHCIIDKLKEIEVLKQWQYS